MALKVLLQELMHDDQFRARFGCEAKNIARLEHAAVVVLYDVGPDDGQPYFVWMLIGPFILYHRPRCCRRAPDKLCLHTYATFLRFTPSIVILYS